MEGQALSELQQQTFRRGACTIKEFKKWFRATFMKNITKLDAVRRIRAFNPCGLTVRQFLFSLTNDIATAEEKLKVDDLITTIKKRLPTEFRREVQGIKFDYVKFKQVLLDYEEEMYGELRNGGYILQKKNIPDWEGIDWRITTPTYNPESNQIKNTKKI
eukprot:Nk52_evm1s1049 gene=Nk52_evmTU1s1049